MMMNVGQLIQNLLPAGSDTDGLAKLSLAVAAGIALGNIRIFGVKLGVAAVLFSALLFGNMGFTIEPRVLEYLRDFALVLFIYSIGLQMGPGFVSSLRDQGLRLNLLAILVIGLGAVLAAVIVKFAHLPRELASGLFTGGFATTPALAAGQEAIQQLAAGRGYDVRHALNETNRAYSVAYPFGLMGPILLVVVFRVLFRVRIADELKELAANEEIRRPPLEFVDVEVLNAECDGIPLRDHRLCSGRGVLFTRQFRDGRHSVPTAATTIKVGDVFRAFGPKPVLDELVPLIGRKSHIDLSEAEGHLQRAELLVTRRAVIRKSLRELDLTNRHGVTLARINRAGVDLPAGASTKLQFADGVTAIGPQTGLTAVATELGNSTDALNQTQLIPIFVGIWLGIIVGSIPLTLPGLHTSLRIGLAGGPMLVAIILSRLGNIGSVVWYMPTAANQLLRDFGMAVFLACVGFQSGDHFLHKVIYEGGLPLIGWGACITLVPMFIVGLFARWFMKMNYVTLCGLISGALTSSPTLLFANEATGSNAAAVGYATVYPLSVMMPVICAQLLVTIMMR
jgi:putative transport protein